jgi:chaperone BCS1
VIDFLQGLASNEIFGGLVGGSLFATTLYALRSVPKYLLQAFLWRFTAVVQVHSDDSAFERLNEWLSEQPFSKKSRYTQLTTSFSDEEGVPVLGPGVGTHLALLGGQYVLVTRMVTEDKASFRRREIIQLRTLGSPSALRGLVLKVTHSNHNPDDSVNVWLYRGYWKKAARKAPRSLDTIFLPEAQKRRILASIERFEASRAEYERHGTPWRWGAFLEGVPGTGKTSLVMALAAHFRRPVYTINIGSLENDNALFDAVLSAPSRCILLIEDIDATTAGTQKRRDVFGPTGPQEETPKPSGVTLSAILNALDGTFTRDGRLLFMTTNHPENVDPALARRVDIREHIGPIEHEVALQMCRSFLGDDGAARAFMKTVQTPIIPNALGRELRKQKQYEH